MGVSGVISTAIGSYYVPMSLQVGALFVVVSVIAPSDCNESCRSFCRYAFSREGVAVLSIRNVPLAHLRKDP